MKVTLLVALFFWGVVPLFLLWLMWRNDKAYRARLRWVHTAAAPNRNPAAPPSAATENTPP